MNKTSIEWTGTPQPDGTLRPGFSANPLKYRDSAGKTVWGCVKHSAGCAHCYSEALAKRYGRGGPFTKEVMRGLTPFLDEKELTKMLAAKTVDGIPVAGSKVFVGDMTDVFGEWVPDELLDQLFAVFALRPDVTWQVLTKRADRMAAYFADPNTENRIDDVACSIGRDRGFGLGAKQGDALHSEDFVRFSRGGFVGLPLDNLWLGTSVENLAALPRIDAMRSIPAAVRFLSVEPLIEDLGTIDLTGIGWVIAGGESGHGARPMHPAWARSIRDQCQAAGVPFFFKQHGEWGPVGTSDDKRMLIELDGRSREYDAPAGVARHARHGLATVYRVGKKAAGRLLDGRTWDEFPEVR